MSGRHRSRLGDRSLRTPIAITGVVALIAVTAIAVRAVAADARGCSGGVQLSVAAAPDLAPAIRQVADRFAQTNPKINGDCVSVQVRAAQPADIANMLATRSGGSINVATEPAPTPSDADIPAVWIPDSTSWIIRMQAVNRDAFEPETRSVAMSPVVFAMPEAIARSLAADGRPHIGAPEIVGLMQKVAANSVKIAAVEPRRDTSGLAGATLLHDAIVTDPKRLVDMVKAYRVINVAPDPATLLKSFAANEIAPMTEQAVLAYDGTAPAAPLAAVPIQPSVALDYPFATVGGKSRAVSQAARLFRTALTDGGNRDLFVKRGFRAPDGTTGPGFPAGHGVTTDQVLAQPVADPTRIADILGYWTATKLPSRVLTLIDVTASMNTPMVVKSGAASRLDVLRKTATEGLRLFTDDSELGLWAFSAGPIDVQDYREIVPVGELNPTQRAKLNAAVGAATASATDVCGLYESVLAAYKSMRDGYRDGRSNTVVVFTDGTNSKPGMTLEQLELELERATDLTRPVRVVLLGVGPDVNKTELDDIAQRTGGRAFSVQDPDQIGNIFLEALLRSNS